jgi:hypothetical protein
MTGEGDACVPYPAFAFTVRGDDGGESCGVGAGGVTCGEGVGEEPESPSDSPEPSGGGPPPDIEPGLAA